MSKKHLFDSSDGLVLKALRGAVALNPSLALHSSSKTVYVRRPTRTPEESDSKVALLAGGGAGHEPAHASYTGRGMLAASVSGDIFASPSASQIRCAIALAASGGHRGNSQNSAVTRPVLVVINNYTGDRLNFGLAIEQARVAITGLEIESVVVADDVSLLHAPSSIVGPRGLAGNILVCKILGACAEKGHSLAVVKILGDAVVANLASVGVGLEHCHVPGRVPGVEQLGDGFCELGLGLHNEPGVKRRAIESAHSLVAEMIDMILASKEDFIKSGEDVILFVNNLGGVSQLEMAAVLDESIEILSERKIHPIRVYLSSFMTSLNANGFSISVLNVSRVHQMLESQMSSSINVLEFLDMPTDALAWIGARSYWPDQSESHLRNSNIEQQEQETDFLLRSFMDSRPDRTRGDVTIHWPDAVTVADVVEGIRSACEAVLAASNEMTSFDTIVGDGDCGETFAAGAKAVLSACNNEHGTIQTASPRALVRNLGELLEKAMGGTIGALFAIFFTAWADALRQTGLTWPSSVDTALKALSRHTPAQPGDRTIVDALHPFARSLGEGGSLRAAAHAARQGAESTPGMQPKLGRAVYIVTDGNDGEQLPPDPGAWGVAAIIEGFCNGMTGQSKQ